MSISIKNVQTERLARELAKLTGRTLTGAIHDALTEKYDRMKLAKSGGTAYEELKKIAHRCAERPNISDLTDDEILGYDENGLPYL